MNRPCRPASRGQAGFSLVELLVASLIGTMAILGILYLYKSQHKTMLVQSGASEMRMNGQFTLNEAQYYLGHAGLGLPSNFGNLLESGGDLVIRMNTAKKSCPAAMDPASNTSVTYFRIARTDTALFSGKAFAASLLGSGVVEAPIVGVAPKSGDPAGALIALAGDKSGFSAATTLYPVERVRLHRCSGEGADTAEGDFRILQEDPGKRAGLRQDSLTLAEGIESLGYRYFLLNRDSAAFIPSRLDSLQRIEIRVVARSRIKDRDAGGDGYKRDTLTAKVGYRRSL
jgi:hypothetical protein